MYILPRLLDYINDNYPLNWCRVCRKENIFIWDFVYIYEVVPNNSVGILKLHENCFTREIIREKVNIMVDGIGADLFFGTKENAIKYVKKLMVML